MLQEDISFQESPINQDYSGSNIQKFCLLILQNIIGEIVLIRLDFIEFKKNQKKQKTPELHLSGLNLYDSGSTNRQSLIPSRRKSDEVLMEISQRGVNRSLTTKYVDQSAFGGGRGAGDVSPSQSFTERIQLINSDNQQSKRSTEQNKISPKRVGRQQSYKQNEQVVYKAKQLQMQKSKIRSIFFKIKLSLNINIFISKLSTLIYKSQYKLFQQYQQYQQMVGDKASIYSFNQKHKSSEQFNQSQDQQQQLILEYQYTSYWKILTSKLKFKEKIVILLDRFPVFQPFSKKRMVWDSIQLISLSFFFILIPLQYAFQDFLTIESSCHTVSILCFFLIIMDILVNFNTSLFIQGKLIENRSQIIQHYKYNGLKKDIITLFPLSILILFHSGDFYIEQKFFIDPILLLFYWKFENCQSFLKKIEVRLHFSPRISQILKLSNLLFLNLYIIHFLACIWILIADKDNQSWMTFLQIQNSHWQIQYICAFYFNTVTMVTVGYGDIYPQTSIERLISVLTVLSACGVFAYSITEVILFNSQMQKHVIFQDEYLYLDLIYQQNKVGSIFQEMQFYKKQIKQNMYIINNYMKKKNISSDLQYQVRDYLEYFWNESKLQDSEVEQKIINQLSNNLKESLMIEANRVFILQSPIFRDNFSIRTILKIISIVREQKYNPEEIIFFEGDTEDSSLYFIEKGQVEIQQASANFQSSISQQDYLTLKQGAFFGEKEFFSGQPRKQSFRSLEFTTLLKIDRDKFLQILKEDNEDYERYCIIRDSIQFRYNTKFVQRKCQFCENVPYQKDEHLESACPIIHYVPNFGKVQAQFKLSQEQIQRQKFQRKNNFYQTKSRYDQTFQNQIQFYSKNLKKIYDYLQRYCPKIDINLQSCQIDNQTLSQRTESRLLHKNTSEYYTQENVTHSSENSQSSYASLEGQSQKSKSMKSYDTRSLVQYEKRFKSNLKKGEPQYQDQLKFGEVFLESQSSSQLNNEESNQKFSQQSQSKQSSSSSISQQSKQKISNSLNSSSSSSKSSSQNSSSLFEETNIEINSQNEYSFSTEKRNRLQPSISYFNLENKHLEREKKKSINPVSGFNVYSLSEVISKNSNVIIKPPSLSIKNSKTNRKLSTDNSQQEFQQSSQKDLIQYSENDSSSNRNLMKQSPNIEDADKQLNKNYFDIQMIPEISNSSQLDSYKDQNISNLNLSDSTSIIFYKPQNIPITIQKKPNNYIQNLMQQQDMFPRRNSQQINKAQQLFNHRSSFRSVPNSKNNKDNVSPKQTNCFQNLVDQQIRQPSVFHQKSNKEVQYTQSQQQIQEIKHILDNQFESLLGHFKQMKEQFEKKKNIDEDVENINYSEMSADFSLLEDFERMKLFEIYFTHNNFDFVINAANEVRRLAKQKEFLQKSDNDHQSGLNTPTLIINKSNRFQLGVNRMMKKLQTVNNSIIIKSNNINNLLGSNSLSKIQMLRNEMVQKSIALSSSRRSIENSYNSSKLIYRRNLSNNLDPNFNPQIKTFKRKRTSSFKESNSGSPVIDQKQQRKMSKSSLQLFIPSIKQNPMDKFVSSIQSQKNSSETESNINKSMKGNKSKFYSPSQPMKNQSRIDFESFKMSVESEELSD